LVNNNIRLNESEKISVDDKCVNSCSEYGRDVIEDIRSCGNFTLKVISGVVVGEVIGGFF
jgi:hypothetical protein